jgi:hypothetical protein
MTAVQMVTGISAPNMGSILHAANAAYTPTAIGQALYDTYPLLTASNLVSILTGPTLFPNMTRDQAITLLSTVGYSQAETLNAVTEKFPFIQTGYGELVGVLYSKDSPAALTYLNATMDYADTAYWYTQSKGPEVSIGPPTKDKGIFIIGDFLVPRSEHVSLTGQYSAVLFPETDFLKQQIICLMAYALQYPYPPQTP